MALFQDYTQKREDLMGKMQNLKEFEASDKVIGYMFEICRQVLSKPGDFQSVNWLMDRGAKLAAYHAYLTGKATEAWAEYKTAEVAFKSVKDGLMLALKNDSATVTEARAQAGRETAEVEVDVLAKEQRFRNYDSAVRTVDKMVSFIQSTLRQKEAERVKTNQN